MRVPHPANVTLPFTSGAVHGFEVCASMVAYNFLTLQHIMHLIHANHR